MNRRKLVDSLLTSGSSGRTTAIAALIGGLAAGVVLGILFAPKSGKVAREKICRAFSGVFDCETQEEESEDVAARSHAHHAGKKPKSDIKELIQHAHGNSEHGGLSLGT